MGGGWKKLEEEEATKHRHVRLIRACARKTHTRARTHTHIHTRSLTHTQRKKEGRGEGRKKVETFFAYIVDSSSLSMLHTYKTNNSA